PIASGSFFMGLEPSRVAEPFSPSIVDLGGADGSLTRRVSVAIARSSPSNQSTQTPPQASQTSTSASASARTSTRMAAAHPGQRMARPRYPAERPNKSAVTYLSMLCVLAGKARVRWIARLVPRVGRLVGPVAAFHPHEEVPLVDELIARIV